MTSLAASATPIGKTFELRLPLWATVLLAALAAQALLASHMADVLSTGAFFDTDDAMRAVQVRDLLAGQSWFDMTAWRLDPPQGVFSHWSRIVDAPLAGLQLLFRLFLNPSHAELATRIVFPFALLIALFSLTPWAARILDPAAVRPLAVLLALLSGAVYTQFLPGRIDHHAPQIVLLMATLGCFLRGLDPAHARAMAPANLAMALSMAISLENLPFFAAILAALPALYVLDGEKMRAPLAWFAASALVAFPVTMAATVAPSRYLLSACDAYSAVYFATVLVGALSMGALAMLATRLSSSAKRAAAVGVVGALVGATYAGIAPQCLGDPLGGVDPLVRDIWLSHVTEALPLWRSWRNSPNTVIVCAVPVLFGLVAALVAACRGEGLARRRWFVVCGVVGIGFALGFFWQVRIFTSVTPVAMIPLVGVATAVASRLGAQYMPLTRWLFAIVVCIVLSPMGVAAVLPEKEEEAASPPPSPVVLAPKAKAGDKSAAAEIKGAHACLTPEALAPLRGLAPGRIAASFDLGPYILAYTPHGVFAGPYHRDNKGNRVVIDAFLADPAAAETVLRGAGANLVLWCKNEPAGFAKRAPDGLGAMLAKGEAPSWLEPLPQSSDTLLVFAVRRKE